MISPLRFDYKYLKYTGIIGTGGIGSGKFFQLNGNNTLGREESRGGHFLDVRDYCKQHIILHYVKVLLGSYFSVTPVGKVGGDDIGNRLYNEMKEVGFNMNHVEKIAGASTLFSFCFHYPDNSGGNMTTSNSASAQVDIKCIDNVENELKRLGAKGIIMAAPEVPLESRYRLLALGKKYNLFCSASFTSEEIQTARREGTLKNVDLLAINLDEAAALTDTFGKEKEAISIVMEAIELLIAENRNLSISITCGKQGSWSWDGHALNNFPAIDMEAKSTAGAGDAFFSGLLCGLALDLPLYEAQQLATLVASISITSPHTIHPDLDRRSLNSIIETPNLSLSKNIKALIED
jgi:ribokinase